MDLKYGRYVAKGGSSSSCVGVGRGFADKSEAKKEGLRKKTWPLVIYLFFFFYAPPLLPIVNCFLLVSLYSAVALLIRYQDVLTFLVRGTGVGKYLAGIGYYLTYFTLLIGATLLAGEQGYWSNYLTSYYSVILMGPCCATCALYAVARFRSLGYGLADAMVCMIKAGLIQSALAILAFADANIRSFFVDIMKVNTGDVIFSNRDALSWRFYGFSNSMLDLFGYTSGLIASLPLYLVALDPKRKGWLLSLPFLIAVPMLNSRSGLVIFAILAFVLALYSIARNARSIASMPFVLVLVILLAIMLYSIVQAVAPATASWITMDLDYLLQGEQSITGRQLFSERFWELPPDILLLSGTSHNRYLVEGFSHTDVGYVNELWRTGIIGSALMYGTHLFLLSRACKAADNGAVKALLVAFGLSLFVMQVKGNVFVYTGGMGLIQTMSFLATLNGAQDSPLCDSVQRQKRGREK